MKTLRIALLVGVLLSIATQITIAANVSIDAYPLYAPRDGDGENVGTPFAVYVSLSEGDASSEYEFKVYPTSDANRARMWDASSQSWIHSGASYGSLPRVTTDSSGNWAGWIYSYFYSTVTSGSNTLRVRFRKVGVATNIDDSKSITIIDMTGSGDGAWIHATAVSTTAGKAVLAFNSSDRIIGIYAIEDNNVVEGYPSTSGYFKMAVPAGTFILKLQARNSDNSVFNTQTSSSWASGGTGTDTDLDVQEDVSLPVTLSFFTAIPIDSGVKLKWRTESEVGNIGFNIYRSETKDGKFIKLNDKLIPGAGNSAMPNDYYFTDKTAIKGKQYYYYLEDVSVDGLRQKSSIISTNKDLKRLTTTWGRIKRG